MDWDVRRFAEVDSTNRVALDQARSGRPAGFVAVAGHQTAGRGRRGRRWEAAPGSALLVSVLLRPDLPPCRHHLAVWAVALAAADACAVVAGVHPELKWPNDLVVGGAKLAGVLAEVERDAVVVGLGLNVAGAGPWPAGAAALESVAGRAVDLHSLLDAFLSALAHRTADWQAVPSAYRHACTTLGRLVRVELDTGTVTGAAAEVTDEGHLLVHVGTCLRTITAGDLVHLRPAAPY
ncbi:MAG: biotin--[acetyl-CoA-carboxylase] ligase [Acidimicrobiales bacterium]